MDHLQLGLTLKRSFDESASSNSTSELPVPGSKTRKLLPLFVWSNNNMKEMEEAGNSGSNIVVGWPPVKSWNKKRIKSDYRHYDEEHYQGGCVINGEDGDDDRKMFVKVSMDGMPIGRKIDLSVYHSYESLTTAILIMFGKYNEQRNLEVKGDKYRVTYLDKEGDWLLVGDVPWRSFIESVQRLKLIKNDRGIQGCS